MAQVLGDYGYGDRVTPVPNQPGRVDKFKFQPAGTRVVRTDDEVAAELKKFFDAQDVPAGQRPALPPDQSRLEEYLTRRHPGKNTFLGLKDGAGAERLRV